MEFRFGYFEGHLSVAILKQQEKKFMPARTLKNNFVFNILWQLFF